MIDKFYLVIRWISIMDLYLNYLDACKACVNANFLIGHPPPFSLFCLYKWLRASLTSL